LPKAFNYIVLPGNNISGKFIKTFSKHKPSILNVANNDLTGDIPGDLLLQDISMIDLSQNRFSSINQGKPWSEKAKAGVKSFVSLAGNRNLSINFTSFIGLFNRVDFAPSPSILNLSFCDIKSPLLANVL